MVKSPIKRKVDSISGQGKIPCTSLYPLYAHKYPHYSNLQKDRKIEHFEMMGKTSSNYHPGNTVYLFAMCHIYISYIHNVVDPTNKPSPKSPILWLL
jgi:hypothetical protein